MPHHAISAIGADRPGIVAAITEALRDIGANLEDVSSTILRGHFAMMLVVDAPEGVPASGIEEALSSAVAPLGVSVFVRDVETGAPERPVLTHVLSVYGADRPGIVAGFARLMADRGVNITDMSCRLVGEARPVYAMIAEVSVPAGLDEAALRDEINSLAEELGVDVRFEPAEPDTF